MNESVLAALPVATRLAQYDIIRLISCSDFVYSYLVKSIHGQPFILKELFPENIVIRNADGSISLNTGQAKEADSWQAAVNHFCSDARMLRQLNLATIPRVVDTFQANHTYYIVQEWIQGESLEKVGINIPLHLHQDRTEFVEQLLQNLLHTLKAIHDKNILHRNIKPSNIIIQDSDRSPILIGFGGECLQIEAVKCNLKKGIWNPGYSSPEQIPTQDREQTPSSDLYSLAACFYFLLFNTEPPDCQQRLLNECCHSFMELKLYYPENLLKSLDKAYHLEPKQRYATAEQWLNDLNPCYLKRWFIGRKPPDIIKVVLEANNLLISRIHLEVRQYADYYLLIDHSSNGCSLIHRDGTKEKINGEVQTKTLNIVVDMAGSVYNLKYLLRHFN